GLGFACLYQAAAVLTATHCRARLGLANAVARSGMGLTFLMAPFTQLLIQAYSWQGTLLIFGGIMLNLVPSSMLLRPASTQPPPHSSAAHPAPGPSVAEKDPESLDGCSDEASHGETQLHGAQDPPSTEGLLMCQGRDATSPAGRLEAAPTQSSAAERSTKAQGSSKALPAAVKAKSQP
ncbi:MOT5 protein, partial [Semnornis frantzii]|nr:MOT5 protein [Semnornis frantzii]